MKLPSHREFFGIREIAEIKLVHQVLRVLDALLLFEHPTIDDPHIADPPSLLAARRVLCASRALRRELHRYRLAALDALIVDDDDDDEIPF